MSYEGQKNRRGQDTTPTVSYDGKMPPQAVELEGAVLGACIVDSSVLAEVGSLLAPEVFYLKENALIYEAIQRLHGGGVSVDLYTVANALRDAGTLEAAGGARRISEVVLSVASGANAANHARKLVEKYVQRQLVEAGYKIVALGHSDGEDVSELLAQSDALLAEVSGALAGRMDIPHVSAPVKAAKEEAYARAERVRQGKQTGVTTGLADLNRATGGWQPANLIIVAARPSMGKTALMLHFAKAAARAGVPAAIFSLEMSATALANRLILSESSVAPSRYRSGYMTNEELQAVDLAAFSASQLPVYIDSTADSSMGQIRAKARALKRKGRCGIVLIDYLQLCRERGMRGRNREQEVAAMSREAKIMAKELEIPVILLSQLSREVERRGGKRPMLSDLRESGAIEQDADMVMFIHRPSRYEGEDDGCGELLIEKNRDGPTSNVNFRYGVGMASIFDAPSPGQEPPPPPPPPPPSANAAPYVSYYEPADREPF
ncbi:MAG: replicative DNA helicase [Prevotellaceae bacterium]|jgi:replicative DNA helicase|nr:replicative DNA helicase [Prevotellaceae bacterium]